MFFETLVSVYLFRGALCRLKSVPLKLNIIVKLNILIVEKWSTFKKPTCQNVNQILLITLCSGYLCGKYTFWRQSSWSKGISEMKSKQQSPCSNCMHRSVISWPITCTYCMGSKVSSLSRIYLYLQLLCFGGWPFLPLSNTNPWTFDSTAKSTKWIIILTWLLASSWFIEVSRMFCNICLWSTPLAKGNFIAVKQCSNTPRLHLRI